MFELSAREPGPKGAGSRIPPTKCPCHACLTLSDNSLSLGSKPHNHPTDNAAPQKREVLSSRKREAAEQPLSVTQNLLSEVLADSTSEANQTLPTIESLVRVVQRSRAKASGSAQHSEAKTSEEFLLPSTCTSTRRDEPFVLFDGKTDRNDESLPSLQPGTLLRSR